MGLLIDGVWHQQEPPAEPGDGAFRRARSLVRDRITADGSSGYRAEPGRYHLFVGQSCPWAHRTVIFRRLKNLESAVSLSMAVSDRDADGWEFTDVPSGIAAGSGGHAALHQVYTAARPDYTGRVTVPTLWDLETGSIVNNESSEIIRMLNSEFDHLGGGIGNPDLDLYPEPSRGDIDSVNELVYGNINNGVYRCGFASSQEAYDQAFDDLFAALDAIEARLGSQRYLAGSRITEADWRLFPTLIRFDAVYYLHFRCNLRHIADYPNLSNYLRELYQIPGIAGTVDIAEIKRQYFGAHKRLNPTGIVPKGPELDFTLPHDRDRI